jgi:hypothetical protein
LAVSGERGSNKCTGHELEVAEHVITGLNMKEEREYCLLILDNMFPEYIARLRKKLHSAHRTKLIRTVYLSGYIVSEAEAEAAQ